MVSEKKHKVGNFANDLAKFYTEHGPYLTQIDTGDRSTCETCQRKLQQENKKILSSQRKEEMRTKHNYHQLKAKKLHLIWGCNWAFHQFWKTDESSNRSTQIMKLQPE